jgi:steroid delta-isomerase-like uncharacterized protein
LILSKVSNQVQSQARVELVEEHIRAENLHDLHRVMDTFGQLPTLDSNGQAYRGSEGIRAVYEELVGAFLDLRIDIKQRYASEEAVVLEILISGKHTGAWQGIPATGRAIEIPACGIFAFDEAGKIESERAYIDGALLLWQLGILS